MEDAYIYQSTTTLKPLADRVNDTDHGNSAMFLWETLQMCSRHNLVKIKNAKQPNVRCLMNCSDHNDQVLDPDSLTYIFQVVFKIFIHLSGADPSSDQ